MLERFGDKLNVAVVGGSGGVGRAIIGQATELPEVGAVYCLSRTLSGNLPDQVPHIKIDVTDEAAIGAAAARIGETGPLDIIIVATGLLHERPGIEPEKDWRHLTAAQLATYFAVNTIGPALVAKHFLPLMRRDTPGVFAALSARVGSISDNGIGGWYGYRASKAALNMIVRNLAIELRRKRYRTICVGLHPGTVETGLSEPFMANTRPGQVVAPEVAARNLLTVIGQLTDAESGQLIAWDGKIIAP